MNKHDMIVAIGLAIGLRDSADHLSRKALEDKIVELSKFSLFSNRQLEAITNGVITHPTIGKLTHKTARHGGRLNPAHLENIRDLMLGFDAGRIDWELIEFTVRNGTSQNLLSKFTGISKSQINRRLHESVQQES